MLVLYERSSSTSVPFLTQGPLNFGSHAGSDCSGHAFSLEGNSLTNPVDVLPEEHRQRLVRVVEHRDVPQIREIVQADVDPGENDEDQVDRRGDLRAHVLRLDQTGQHEAVGVRRVGRYEQAQPVPHVQRERVHETQEIGDRRQGDVREDEPRRNFRHDLGEVVGGELVEVLVNLATKDRKLHRVVVDDVVDRGEDYFRRNQENCSFDVLDRLLRPTRRLSIHKRHQVVWNLRGR